MPIIYLQTVSGLRKEGRTKRCARLNWRCNKKGVEDDDKTSIE